MQDFLFHLISFIFIIIFLGGRDSLHIHTLHATYTSAYLISMENIEAKSLYLTYSEDLQSGRKQN